MSRVASSHFYNFLIDIDALRRYDTCMKIVLSIIVRASHVTHDKTTFDDIDALIQHLEYDRNDAIDECIVRHIAQFSNVVVITFDFDDLDACDYVVTTKNHDDASRVYERVQKLYAKYRVRRVRRVH